MKSNTATTASLKLLPRKLLLCALLTLAGGIAAPATVRAEDLGSLGSIDNAVPAEIRAQWDAEAATFREDRKQRMEQAKTKAAKVKTDLDNLTELAKSEQPEAQGPIKDKQLKLIDEWESINKAYYSENLRRLTDLMARYGNYPEFKRKISEEIATQQARRDEAIASAASKRDSLGGTFVKLLGREDRTEIKDTDNTTKTKQP